MDGVWDLLNTIFYKSCGTTYYVPTSISTYFIANSLKQYCNSEAMGLWVFFILLELCKRKDYNGFSKEKIGSGSTTKQKYEKMYVVPLIVQNILTKIHT